jgi:hypothetical protein
MSVNNGKTLGLKERKRFETSRLDVQFLKLGR